MQIFRCKRGVYEYGWTSITKEYFGVHKGETVLSVETEGVDVVVVIAGKMIKPSNLVLYNDLIKEWRNYFDHNRYRFDLETYVLHPAGTRMDMYDNTQGEKFRLVSKESKETKNQEYGPLNEYQARLKKEIDTTSYLINHRREVLFRSWD